MKLRELLSRGRAEMLTRLLQLIAVLLGLGGLLLLLAPLPEATALRDVAGAAPRQNLGNNLLFPKFSELQASRASPFVYREVTRVQVPLRQRAAEAAAVAAASAAPPPPGPDTAGLELIGTVPGGPHKLAMLRDRQSNAVTVFEQGGALRGAVLHTVEPDRIVLRRNDQNAELHLSQVAGSDALHQQLLSPPGLRDPTQHNETTAAVAPAPAPTSAPAPKRRTSPPSDEEPAKPRSLGVSGYIMPPAKQEELHLKQPGLIVTGVQRPESPFKPEDVILAIDGKGFTSVGEAMSILQKSKEASITVTLFREGAKQDVSVELE